MTILLWWREIIIAALVIGCLWLVNGNQELDFKVKEIELQHKSEILKVEAKNAKLVSDVQEQRKNDLEKFLGEKDEIINQYNIALASSKRVQSEIKTFTDRLHTFSRETVENNARTCGILYGELRTEIIGLGRYASEINAELNKVTKQEDVK